MNVSLQCPQCQHEFSLRDARPDTVAVCPKCFHVFPLPASTYTTQTTNHLDILEELWQESLAGPGSVTPSAEGVAPSSAHESPRESASGKPPRPTVRQAQHKKPPLPPAQEREEKTWQAIVLGCLLPLLMLAAIVAFLLWYIASHSLSQTGEPMPLPMATPRSADDTPSDALAERAIRELLAIDAECLQAMESFLEPGRRHSALLATRDATRRLYLWRQEYGAALVGNPSLDRVLAQHRPEFLANQQRFRTLLEQVERDGLGVVGSPDETDLLIALDEYQQAIEVLLATLRSQSAAKATGR